MFTYISLFFIDSSHRELNCFSDVKKNILNISNLIILSAFSYRSNDNPKGSEVGYDFYSPGKHDVSVAQSRDFLDQSDEAVYKIIILRY